jgi:hypothetical protein
MRFVISTASAYVLVLAAATVLVGVTPVAHAASAGLPTVTAHVGTTQVVDETPVNGNGRLDAGYSVARDVGRGGNCERPSRIVAGADLCRAREFSRDPCWRLYARGGKYRGDYCLVGPRTHTGVVFRAQTPFNIASGGATVWGLKLADGAWCKRVARPYRADNGSPLRMECAHHRWLAGRPRKEDGHKWSVKKVTLKRGVISRVHTVPVNRAWIARTMER